MLPTLPVLYALFVVSGAAGLMYESIWSRYLGLFVGHGAYAQVLVLVIFLGGMSLGAALVGRRSSGLRAPLRWYAAAELAVALIALVFHALYVGLTDWSYATLFPALGAGWLVTLVKWTLAALLILPQSVLLGTTFPLMSAGALRAAPGASGRTLSLLYFANSLGAAGGVLVAGFALLGAVGLPGTLRVAALLNALVALGAWLVARETEAEAEGVPATAVAPAATTTPVAVPAGASRVPPALTRALLVVAFGTAVASFVYEIAWLRMLSLVVGSATHSFEIMLSSFILGLALGAWWIRGRADRLADPLRTLGMVQWVMGSLAIATLPVYLWTFHAMASLLEALDYTVAGYRAFTIARYLLCLAVMLPATFCAGITLPLITRILLERGGGAGRGATGGDGERAVGQVYAVNTLGSILGAALAGLVLMPLLGLRWLIVAGALADAGLGIWLLRRHAALVPLLRGDDAANGAAHPATPAPAAARRASRWRTGPSDDAGALVPVALVGSAALLLVAGSIPFDPAVLTSGTYRYAVVSDPRNYVVPFYADGRTATVSVRRHVESDVLTLATNGKPDASLGREWIRPSGRDTVRRALTGDQITQALLPLLALAHVPQARSAAVIGQGSGMTSHLLLGSPHLRSLATVDIEPEMIRGSRLFYPANRRVFDDPRSQFVVDDAKAYFASARRRYDLIVSEPSNPWVSGVSGLFTDEFYARVRGYLAPGGVFGQWLHLYEIDDDLVVTVLAALHRHFPSYTVYLASQSDLFVVATNDATLRPPDWRVVELPEVRRDLARALPLDSASLAALRLADRAALAPLLDRAESINSDYFPVLDLGAERTRFLKRSASGLRGLAAGRFDPIAAMRGWRVDAHHALHPALLLPRHVALARGAVVRAAWDTHQAMPDDEAPWLDLDAEETAAVRDALYRRGTLEAELARTAAPVDWHRFVAHALDVVDDAMGGTAGVTDTALVARIRAWAVARRAPREALAALDFAQAASTWDWPATVAAAEPLVAAAAKGDAWVPGGLLHDAAIVAALRTGDAERAVRWAAVLGPRTRRGRDDVRGKLFSAWIAEAAERRGSGAGAARPVGAAR